ncbi:hypothetical protein [Bradyrhizobium sp. SZCCHNS3053]|uniref:helix-turn-helix transcriptional regulator n=1 Tax=Bradyrhizobium sp. SZCCHNS3053 TaxID=3057322 RepID=UPI0029169A17|nr:hypothetical protein [Bradyrhizobium sp. SZCCHNS3053]
MTIRKTENLLRGDRTPAYVTRETGAAELLVSPATWDQWVKDGRLPPPSPSFPAGTPRWRWEDVDRRLRGTDTTAPVVDAMQWAASFGKKKGKRSGAA